jgi:hypothetical protein
MSAMSYPHHTENPAGQITGRLATGLGLHPLAVQDSTQFGQRAKAADLRQRGHDGRLRARIAGRRRGDAPARNRQRLLEPEMATHPAPDLNRTSPASRRITEKGQENTRRTAVLIGHPTVR